MNQVRWLGVCRWVHILLVVVYVLATIMVVVVVLLVFGVRLANGTRWLLLTGWFGLCFGGVVVLEWMGIITGQGCRLPIRSEEEKLFALMDEVQKRMNSKEQTIPEKNDKPARALERPMRLAIRKDPTGGNGSFGYRTIIISSGTLMLASDEELRGILAHELGHLRDGDRIWEAAFFCSSCPARLFRLGCRLILVVFRTSALGGLLMLVLMSPVLLPLLILFLIYLVFREGTRLLSVSADYRQDCRAVRSGCGKGLRDWLEKSGLSMNVNRIRRLEKML